MTAYADVPSVTSLHGEAEQVATALAILTDGGTMIQFTVAPAAAASTGAIVMPVAIRAPSGTVTQATLDDLTAWLNTRASDLAAQLAALGVT